jgi:hypothetical protein
LGRLQELLSRDLQRGRESTDRLETSAAGAALKLRNRQATHAGRLRELLLGQQLGLARRAQSWKTGRACRHAHLPCSVRSTLLVHSPAAASRHPLLTAAPTIAQACSKRYMLVAVGGGADSEPERGPQASPPGSVWAPRAIQLSGRLGPFGSSHRRQRSFRTVRTIRRNVCTDIRGVRGWGGCDWRGWWG